LPQSTLIVRHMLPDPSFSHAIQNAKQGREQATMADFYPTGEYFAHAGAFGQLGCPVNTAQLPYPGQ
jgi:hypothetical protein